LLLSRNEPQFQDPHEARSDDPSARSRSANSYSVRVSKTPRSRHSPDTRVEKRWSLRALIRGVVVTTVATFWLLTVGGANTTARRHASKVFSCAQAGALYSSKSNRSCRSRLSFSRAHRSRWRRLSFLRRIRRLTSKIQGTHPGARKAGKCGTRLSARTVFWQISIDSR